MNKPRQTLKKLTLILAIFAGGSLMLCGCANDEYAIEKKYWKIKKQAEKILRNPLASPPNELEKTVEALNKFSEQFPKSNLGLDAEFRIANLYIIKENYDLGRQQLRKIMEKYSRSKELSAQVLFLIGKSYELQEKWASALEQYKKIMQNYSETIRGLEMPIYIAQRYKAKFEPDKMIAALQEAVSYYKGIAARHPLTPLSFNLDMLIAKCYMELKEWQKAVDTLNLMLATYNGKVTFEEILLTLANIHSQKLNNPGKAVEILEVLLTEYPKSRYIKSAKEMINRLSAKQ